jgi:hypothetical protein
MTDICVAFTFDARQSIAWGLWTLSWGIFSSENGQKVRQVVDDDRRPTINFGCNILRLSSAREDAFEPKN